MPINHEFLQSESKPHRRGEEFQAHMDAFDTIEQAAICSDLESLGLPQHREDFHIMESPGNDGQMEAAIVIVKLAQSGKINKAKAGVFVATLDELRTLLSGPKRSQGQIVLVEATGATFRFVPTETTLEASDPNNIVTPADITEPAAGRWVRVEANEDSDLILSVTPAGILTGAVTVADVVALLSTIVTTVNNINNSQDWKVEQFALSAADISNKYVDVSGVVRAGQAARVSLASDVGGAHSFGGDYEVIADGGTNLKRISWSGKAIDGRIVSGNTLTVRYPAAV